MAQYARPESDLSSGSWTPSTGSTLYECVDEESASDADYIYSDTDDDSCLLGLSEVTDPESSSGHTVRWRWMTTGSGPPTELCSAYLFQAGILRATLALEAEVNRGSFEAKSYTLSAGEADAITDYSDLRVNFFIDRTGSGEEIQISWVELEVPDAPGPGGESPSNLMLLGVG